MHTLLRYPGGKTRAVKKLYEHFPADHDKVISPFFGGGAFEIFLANKGVEVYGYDSFGLLVDFWQEVIDNRLRLYLEIENLLNITKEDFYLMQKTIEKVEDKTKRAAYFFALNRSSFSGTTLSGGMSKGHPRFNRSAVEKVKNFNAFNLSVRLADFSESISSHDNGVFFCDPPYLLESNLYGNKGDLHKNFDHQRFKESITVKSKFMVCYNDSTLVREMYKEYDIIDLQWSYGMNKTKKSSEILIKNF